MSHWQPISICTSKDVGFKTIGHVAIKTDGQLAILISDMDVTVLWDIYLGEWLSTLPNDCSVLEKYLSREGFLNLNFGTGKGKYRVLGNQYCNPLLEHTGFEQGIAVDAVMQTIFLYNLNTDQKECEIPYTPQTDEEILTSFSDDGTMLAVLESSQVTFFARGK